MDLEWETFKAQAALNLSKGQGQSTVVSKGKLKLQPPPGQVSVSTVVDPEEEVSTVRPRAKRGPAPVLAALRNSRISRSLDTFAQNDDVDSVRPTIELTDTSQTPDVPRFRLGAGKRGSSPKAERRDKGKAPAQPVSPRANYDSVFKLFGRKKDKLPAKASEADTTLVDQPARDGKLASYEELARSGSTKHRGWRRSQDKRSANTADQSDPIYSIIRQDVMQRLLDTIPDDVYFRPLVEDVYPKLGEDEPTPACYIEGPDTSEAQATLHHYHMRPRSKSRLSQGSDTGSDSSEGESPNNNSSLKEGAVRACGQSVSTYPRVLALPGARLGDPVCDCFALRVYQNGSIFCVCDGCGWGRTSVEAANVVRSVFMQSLHQHPLVVVQSSRRELKRNLVRSTSSEDQLSAESGRQRARSDAEAGGGGGGGKGKGKVRRSAHKVMEMMGVSAPSEENGRRSIRAAAECLLRLVVKAHTSILAGKEVWECGTTTVCAGIVVDLDLPSPLGASREPSMSKKSGLLFSNDKKPQARRTSDATQGIPTKKGIIFVSIGDCKVFLYSHLNGTVKDLTFGNRMNATSVNDCGGRLGPAAGTESSEPDLRNLEIYFFECYEGDCVWAVSDGVHDNFDPQMVGLQPHDIDERESADWELISPETAARLKNAFSIRALERELLAHGGAEQTPATPPEVPAAAKGPVQIAASLCLSGESSTQIFYNSMAPTAQAAAAKFPAAPEVILSKPVEGSLQPVVVTPTLTAAVKPVADEACPVVMPSDGPQTPPELSRIALSGLCKDEFERRPCTVINPAEVTRKLIGLCLEQTQHTRNFMEQNPDKRQPCDYRVFPGKLDHTTCLAFHA